MLGGRYRLAEPLGSGGMGTVYRAHDTRLDRPVAVKVLRESQDVDDVTRARLRAEARFAGGLRHPGIVQVYDYGEEPGTDAEPGPTPYVVMQHVEGTPLSALVREQGPLPAHQVAGLVAEVGRALAAAHRAGIVHRDLKPSNIVVTPAGRAVLVDFGVARSDSADPLTSTGLIIGSVDYLSPEQVTGQRATTASDVYALGVVAHQCLTANPPFRRDTQAGTALARLHEDPPALGPEVPARLRDLIGEMTARDPADRPTAAAVAAEAEAVARQPARVLPAWSGPPPPPAPRPRHLRITRFAAAVVAAAVIAVVAVALARGHEVTPPAGAADVVVPAVEGQPVGRAARTLHAAGFDVARKRVDGPSEAGLVLHQSPAPGPLEGAAGVTVTLRVASGWVRLDRDALTGTTYDAARRAVADLGLVPARVDRASTAAPGTVVAVEPDDRVRVGSTVILLVATAPQPAPKPPHVTPHQPQQPHKEHGKPPGKGPDKHGKGKH